MGLDKSALCLICCTWGSDKKRKVKERQHVTDNSVEKRSELALSLPHFEGAGGGGGGGMGGGWGGGGGGWHDQALPGWGWEEVGWSDSMPSSLMARRAASSSAAC